MRKFLLLSAGTMILVFSGCQMPNVSQMTEKFNEKLAKIDVMNEKINNLETKMDKMQQQIDDLEERVIVLETKLEQKGSSYRSSGQYERSGNTGSKRNGTGTKTKTKKKIR